MTDKNLDKIAALLRKAERTDNEHEKDAFFTAAQRLATRNSIDLAVARAHTARKEDREVPENRSVRIGTKGKHANAQFIGLFSAIARANDVKCFIAHDKTVVYPMGFPSDLDVVEALYSSLVVQMVQASEDYLKTGEYKSETAMRKVTKDDGYYRYQSWEERPIDGRTARRSFYQSFTSRISVRLTAAKDAEVETVEAEVNEWADNGKSLTSTALVLREKKAEIDTFVDSEHKRLGVRGSYRGSKASTHSAAARRAGDAAGRSARLSGQQGLPSGRSRISA